jgi:hypothetical protein
VICIHITRERRKNKNGGYATKTLKEITKPTITFVVQLEPFKQSGCQQIIDYQNLT